MKRNQQNYLTYVLMILLFGIFIYVALSTGEQFDHLSKGNAQGNESALELFVQMVRHNLGNSITTLLFQIIIILVTVRIFSFLFKFIGQPGVIGEIVAGIVLGPSLLGHFFPGFYHTLFPEESLNNLYLLSQIGLVLFMFVIGMELDFGVLKKKLNETLVISHAGIIVPFFLGTVVSIWVYEEYAAEYTSFLPFALFIGISMSITAFPVLARIIQERNMTKSSVGILSIASAANDDVTAWCLLAVVIAIAKAGSVVSALFTILLVLVYILIMFMAVRPFLRKIGATYANSEVINKSFVSFIFLTLIISSVTTEIIGIHALFGAFMAGVIMPTNIGFRKVMMEKVEDIALVFFLPLFFAFTGLRTEIGLINTPELFGVCAIFIVVAVAGKLGGCAIAARLVGESWKDSLIVGTLMNTRGLMELIALNIGYEMGILPPEIFVILVIMALLTTFMTTPLLHWVERFFVQKKIRMSEKFKIMISFGRPESGQILLYFANLLFGNRLQKSEVIASHFTLGTDLNPVLAEEYEKESFSPIMTEARQLQVNIKKQYKVTDKIIQDVTQTVTKEKVSFLFVGAGKNFLTTDHMTIFPDMEKHTFISRLISIIKKPSYYLPGSLLREKTEEILNQLTCDIGIFVNKNYKRLSTLYMVIDSPEDLFLLNYIDNLLVSGIREVHIVSQKKHLYSSLFEKDEFLKCISKNPDQIILDDKEIEDNQKLFSPGSFILMSYETAVSIAENKVLYKNLPSALIIKRRID